MADLTREAAKGEPSSPERRIAEELELMKTAGIIEIAVRNPNVADYMRHWEARATALETANAALTARLAALEGFITEFAAAKIEALRFPGVIRSPEDEPDPVVEATEVWAWQEDASAALASHGKEPT